MLQIMFIIFIVAGKYTGYKAGCSSHHVEDTFLCMRQTPRGLTPSTTGMDDRQGTRKVRPTHFYILLCVMNIVSAKMSFCPYCGERISSSDIKNNQCPNCGAYLEAEPLTSPPPSPPPKPTVARAAPPPPPPPIVVPKASRPIGVSVIAIITLLEGIVFLGVGGLVALAGGITDIFWIAAVGGLVLLFGIIFLALGVGLWNLRSWAWWLTIIFEILGIIGTLVLTLAFPPAFILTIISALVLIYLLTVKTHFY